MTGDASAAAILARVKLRLAATGLSARQASIMCGAESVIPNLRKGSEPAVRTLAKLAEVLETTPEYLAFGTVHFSGHGLSKLDHDTGVDASHAFMLDAAAPIRIPSVPIIGEVSAGHWMDVETAADASPFERIYCPPNPQHEASWQFGAIAKGTSINRVAPNGSILTCVDVQRARLQPRMGELVIAELRRAGGHEIMRTAKRYRPRPSGDELWPDSTDPLYQKPIAIPRDDQDESFSVQILGIVTWIHRPFDSSARPWDEADNT